MLRNYLLMAIKVLRRRAFFTFATLFGISFTLCILMVAVAFLDQLFGATAPRSELDRMLFVERMQLRGENNTSSSNPGYRFLDEHLRDLPHTERITFFSDERLTATFRDGAKIPLHVKHTDGAFWQIFDLDFIEGNHYTDTDTDTANPVAVISAKTRDQLFDGKAALDRTLLLDGRSYRIIGVVADVSRMVGRPFSDIWVPLSTAESQAFRERFMGGFNAAILAESKNHLAPIKAEIQARVDAVDLSEFEQFDRLKVLASTAFEATSEELAPGDSFEARPMLLRMVIGGAMLLFMLLPSLNLINLGLSRMLERSSEIGVRRAFGAHRGALMTQFLVENVVVTLIGGGLAWIAASLILRLLNQAGVAMNLALALNLRIFLWGIALSLVFGVLSGLLPAWRMSRLSPVAALRQRGSSR